MEWGRRKAQLRARVEHPFPIIKNLAQLHSLFTLVNLLIDRRRLATA